MIVRYWMKREVVTVDVNDPIKKALHRFRIHKARFLPVLENGKLVGVLSERDMKKGLGLDSPFKHLEEWMVGDSSLTVRAIGPLLDNKPTVGLIISQFFPFVKPDGKQTTPVDGPGW